MTKEEALTSPDLAYLYAIAVIKGRWPEGEKLIATDAGNAYLYAVEVIKGRWPEAERVLQQSESWTDYLAMVALDYMEREDSKRSDVK